MKTFVFAVLVAMLCGGCARYRGAAGSPAGVETKRVGAITIEMPTEASDIFAEIAKHEAELTRAVQFGQFREASDRAAAIRELAGRIPQRATFDTRAEVGAAVRRVSEATKEIEKASDALNRPEMLVQLRGLDALIEEMQKKFKPL